MTPILLAGEPDAQAIAIAAGAAVFLIVAFFAMTIVMATKYYKRCSSNATIESDLSQLGLTLINSRRA